MEAVTIKKHILWSILSILIYMCIGTFSDIGRATLQQNHFSSYIESQFLTKNNTRIIAQKGGLAILPCVVNLNSPATVSWIRRKDFQLLTVGLSTHSSDKRFLVEHTRHMGHWSLRIKSINENDQGTYECQLSIHPTQSIFVELNIIEAVAEISGSSDLYIDEGSTIRLECKVNLATENPAYIFWYHNKKMVNYDKQNGFYVTSNSDNILTSVNKSMLYKNNTLKNMYKKPAQRTYQINETQPYEFGSINMREELIMNEQNNTDFYNNSKNYNNNNTTIIDQYNTKNIKNDMNIINKLNNRNKQNNSNINNKRNKSTKNNLSVNSKYEFNEFGSINTNSKWNVYTKKPAPLTTKQVNSLLYILTISKSTLTLQDVRLYHAGNYTCAPSNARSASISVHVLRGDKPAAMQHSNHSIENESNNCSVITTLCINTSKASIMYIESGTFLFVYTLLTSKRIILK